MNSREWREQNGWGENGHKRRAVLAKHEHRVRECNRFGALYFTAVVLLLVYMALLAGGAL